MNRENSPGDTSVIGNTSHVVSFRFAEYLESGTLIDIEQLVVLLSLLLIISLRIVSGNPTESRTMKLLLRNRYIYTNRAIDEEMEKCSRNHHSHSQFRVEFSPFEINRSKSNPLDGSKHPSEQLRLATGKFTGRKTVENIETTYLSLANKCIRADNAVE